MATLRPDRKPGANLRIDMEKWQSTEYHLSGRQGRTEYGHELEGVSAFGPMASDRDLRESGRSAGAEVGCNRVCRRRVKGKRAGGVLVAFGDQIKDF